MKRTKSDSRSSKRNKISNVIGLDAAKQLLRLNIDEATDLPNISYNTLCIYGASGSGKHTLLNERTEPILIPEIGELSDCLSVTRRSPTIVLLEETYFDPNELARCLRRIPKNVWVVWLSSKRPDLLCADREILQFFENTTVWAGVLSVEERQRALDRCIQELIEDSGRVCPLSSEDKEEIAIHWTESCVYGDIHRWLKRCAYHARDVISLERKHIVDNVVKVPQGSTRITQTSAVVLNKHQVEGTNSL